MKTKQTFVKLQVPACEDVVGLRCAVGRDIRYSPCYEFHMAALVDIANSRLDAVKKLVQCFTPLLGRDTGVHSNVLHDLEVCPGFIRQTWRGESEKTPSIRVAMMCQ